MNIKDFIKNELSGWNRQEFIFLVIALSVIIFSSIIFQDSKIALLSAICGVIYTIMAGKGKLSCYFFGIIGTLCYSYLAFKNTLYGNLALYLGYYFPMEIIGIFVWKKHLLKEGGIIEKTFLSKKQRFGFLLGITVLGIIFSYILGLFGDKYPIADSFITILSIAGMYLTVRRCIEQWIIWTFVNTLSIGLWMLIFLDGGKTFATLLMWLIYWVIGIYYFFEWRKEIYSKLID